VNRVLQSNYLRPARACAVIGLVAALVLFVGGRVSHAASPTDPIFTIAGTGTSGHVGNGGASEAQLNQPRSIAPTADGGYVFAEPFNHTVRLVRPDGTVARLAGTGIRGYSGDGGPATKAQVNFVHAASPTHDGGVLIADTLNDRIRKVWPNGTITTVAGNGHAGYSGDGGPATAASINNPRGVVSTSDGGFLIPDSNNHRVRRVSPTGTITTVAGTGIQGFSGDGGHATAAKLSFPFGVSPLADGGFLFVDASNQRIRRVRHDGTIITVAGTGVGGFSGDGGPATSANLNNPHNVWATADGGFLIADTSNARIRRVDPHGIISTLVGNGTPGFSGDDGLPAEAQVAVPKAVAETPAGNVLIADTNNNRIRYIGGFCRVPSVAGRTLASARASLVAAGCRLGSVGKGFSKKVKKGRIVSQSPGASYRLYEDGRVALVVSRGRTR
jgi:PASTA domain-containing protein/NHL repeat-containing protein